MATITQAVLAINPDAQIGVVNEDIDQITWGDGTTPIAKETILAKQAELKISRAHIVPRRMAYPRIGDQLDMIYHDQVDGTTTFQDAIKAVKDANPKS